jgi:hypothetical protein
MNVTDRIFEWFETLKKRPLMILSNDSNYQYLQNYVEGYIDGLAHFSNKNVRLDITNWFQQKVDDKTSYYWTNHIPIYYKHKTDEELKLILLETTEAYFRENPNWYNI